MYTEQYDKYKLQALSVYSKDGDFYWRVNVMLIRTYQSVWLTAVYSVTAQQAFDVASSEYFHWVKQEQSVLIESVVADYV